MKPQKQKLFQGLVTNFQGVIAILVLFFASHLRRNSETMPFKTQKKSKTHPLLHSGIKTLSGANPNDKFPRPSYHIAPEKKTQKTNT